MLLAALIEEALMNANRIIHSSWVFLYAKDPDSLSSALPTKQLWEHHNLPNFLSPHFMSHGAIRTLEERPTASDSQGCVDAPFLRKACLK